jgi:hypothetical protein
MFELKCCTTQKVLQLWYKVYLRQTSCYEDFYASYHCRFKLQTSSDSITAGLRLKPAVMTQYHYLFKPKADSDDSNITAGFWLEPAVMGRY